MVTERKNRRLIVTVLIALVFLFVSAIPVSAETNKNIPNGKTWNVKTSFLFSSSATLKIAPSNWDRCNGGDIWAAKVYVTDWQTKKVKIYTYRSSNPQKVLSIKLPNKHFKNCKYSVCVKWGKTEIGNWPQKYKASIKGGSFF